MEILVPTNCPCCDSALENVNGQLFCRNNACPAQLYKRIEHFAKTVGIKGLGPKTVEKLAPKLTGILDIYYLDEPEIQELLKSEKISQKLFNEIRQSIYIDFATALSAFSIPLIGKTAATKISSVASTFGAITPAICKAAGLGEKATNNLMWWIETEYQEIKFFLPFQFKTIEAQTPIPSRGTVCITGKLSSFNTKLEAQNELTNLGFTVKDSMSKAVNYLVDEVGAASSKRVKAEEYGIQIITNLKTFLENLNK